MNLYPWLEDYLMAKPGAEGFYEKIGCERSLPSFLIPGAGAKDEE